MTSALTQGYAFLAYLYAGVVLGILYDALQIFAYLLRKNIFQHLCDAVFVLAFACVTYAAFQLCEHGVLRLYGFAAMGLGAAIAHRALGGMICKRIVKRHR